LRVLWVDQPFESGAGNAYIASLVTLPFLDRKRQRVRRCPNPGRMAHRGILRQPWSA
jgi:hypothetical protein